MGDFWDGHPDTEKETSDIYSTEEDDVELLVDDISVEESEVIVDGRGIPSLVNDNLELDDEGIAMVYAKVNNRALIDLPHIRPQCGTYTFNRKETASANRLHCPQCFCYVCDTTVKECKSWWSSSKANAQSHCNAFPSADKNRPNAWDSMRKRERISRPFSAAGRFERQTARPALPSAQRSQPQPHKNATAEFAAAAGGGGPPPPRVMSAGSRPVLIDLDHTGPGDFSWYVRVKVDPDEDPHADHEGQSVGISQHDEEWRQKAREAFRQAHVDRRAGEAGTATATARTEAGAGAGGGGGGGGGGETAPPSKVGKKPNTCKRCGRVGHTHTHCYWLKDVNGDKIEKKQAPRSGKTTVPTNVTSIPSVAREWQPKLNLGVLIGVRSHDEGQRQEQRKEQQQQQQQQQQQEPAGVNGGNIRQREESPAHAPVVINVDTDSEDEDIEIASVVKAPLTRRGGHEGVVAKYRGRNAREAIAKRESRRMSGEIVSPNTTLSIHRLSWPDREYGQAPAISNPRKRQRTSSTETESYKDDDDEDYVDPRKATSG